MVTMIAMSVIHMHMLYECMPAAKQKVHQNQ